MKFSYLAAIETLIVSAASITIAYNFGEYWHVLLGSLFAPFLLLKTDESQALGLKLYEKFLNHLQHSGFFYNSIDKVNGSDNDTLNFFSYQFYVIVIVGSFCIKVYATVITLCRSPLSCLSSIQRNWYYQCFQINFRSSLEPVPGARSYPKYLDYRSTNLTTPWQKYLINILLNVLLLLPAIALTFIANMVLIMGILFLITSPFSYLLNYLEDKNLLDFMSQNQFLGGVFAFIISGLFISIPALFVFRFSSSIPELLVRIPAICYRWSLKSTFIIWSPLLWVVNPLPRGDDNQDEVLDEVKHGVLSVISYFYSAAVLIVFFVKIYFIWKIHAGLTTFTDEVVESVVVDLYLWQIVAFIYVIINLFGVLAVLTGVIGNIRLHGQLWSFM